MHVILKKIMVEWNPKVLIFKLLIENKIITQKESVIWIYKIN